MEPPRFVNGYEYLRGNCPKCGYRLILRNSINSATCARCNFKSNSKKVIAHGCPEFTDEVLSGINCRKIKRDTLWGAVKQ